MKTDIEKILGMSIEDIRDILFHSFYREKTRVKKTGGTRKLYVPSLQLKIIQKKINEESFTNIKLEEGMRGVKQTTHVDHVKDHVGSKYLITTDIKSFFPSVNRKEIYKSLKSLGLYDDISVSLLVDIVSHNGCLPQGAPTSTFLALLTIEDIFKDVKTFAKARNVKITVFVDDWAISGNNKRNVLDVYERLKRLLSEQRLLISEEKTKITNRRNEQKIMNINVGNQTSVPNKYIEEVMLMIRKLKDKSCKEREQEYRRIKGKIAYIKIWNQKSARKLTRFLTKTLMNLRESK